METINIKFPNSEMIELEIGKPVVLLGANGAGKTRFGVKIEELNDGKFSRWGGSEDFLVHRISAQKSLSIGEKIVVSDNESSKHELFYGSANPQADKTNNRYGYSPATHLLDDYDKALSFLFSEANKELQEANSKDKLAVKLGQERPNPVETVVDRATDIWNELLPHRKIDLSGNGVRVQYNEDNYHGKEMSDGERVILYMICQALVLRPKSLMIIDEPELHIHKAIVDKLWTRLESERPDCVFMYITHDLNFSLSRINAKTLWIKSYNGSTWEYELIDAKDYNDLPSGLLYEIIGTRQKVLFVEGERNSYDHQLYQEIYKDKGYHVIPCGGCHEVVRLVKSKKQYEQLSSIEVVGLIDRDFRTDFEIEALKNDGIYFLDVAEVENLFIVPEVLEIMERELVCDEGAAQAAKDFILQKFLEVKELQINLALKQELEHKLAKLDFNKSELSSNDIKSKIDSEFSLQKIESYRNEKSLIFDNATDVKSILKVFNFKPMSNMIGCKFGINNNHYHTKVLNLLRGKKVDVRQEIVNVLKLYCPDLP